MELGLRSLAEPFQEPRNPVVAAIGYAILGAFIRGLSLLVLSSHLVPEGWRDANLLVTPVMVGLLMTLVGLLRARRGQSLI